MKNILSVIILLSALFGIANAQSGPNSLTALVVSYNTTEHVIIKEYQYPSTICCYLEDTTAPGILSSFSYQNPSTMYSRRIYLSDYIVNDFEISNDSVFFCGYDTANNGIIGFFNIQDLFFNGGDFYIQNDFVTQDPDGEQYPVGRLSKLVTYINNYGLRHIVCVGRTNEVKPPSMSCIVDMHSFPLMNGDLPVWAYESGLLNKSAPTHFLDIAIVGNFLVTAGFDFDKHITLRSFDMDNVFSSTGPQNYPRTFNIFDPLYEGPKVWNPDEILIAVQSTDSFYTAATWNYYYENTKAARKINVAKYGISMLYGNISNTMASFKNINISGYPNEVSLQGFLVNWDKRKLAFLFDGKSATAGIHSIFLESNYKMTVSRANINNCYISYDVMDAGLGGIDLFNSRTQYIMAGRCTEENNYHTFNVETAGVNSSCQPLLESSFYTLPNVSADPYNEPLTIFAGVYHVQRIPHGGMHNYPIQIDCYE